MLSKNSIKYIQSLQHKKFRDADAVFVAEGPKLVNELLQSKKFVCKSIFALDAWLQHTAPNLVLDYAPVTTIIQPFELDKIAHYTTPNEVVAVFEQRKQELDFSPEGQWTLMLDDIRDPGNLGTIIRTADWFGISNIVCSPGTVDMYNCKVVQSTMASLGRANIVYTELVPWLQEHPGLNSFAAILGGKQLPQKSAYASGVIIIGNEANGIHETLASMAKERVSIPGSGGAESLNAAVAAAILMYHFCS